MDSPYKPPGSNPPDPETDPALAKARADSRVLGVTAMAATTVVYYMAKELGLPAEHWTTAKGSGSGIVALLLWKQGVLPCSAIIGTAAISLAISYSERRRLMRGFGAAAVVIAIVVFCGLWWLVEAMAPSR